MDSQKSLSVHLADGRDLLRRQEELSRSAQNSWSRSPRRVQSSTVNSLPLPNDENFDGPDGGYRCKNEFEGNDVEESGADMRRR